MSSFVKKDLEILSHYFKTDPIQPQAFIVPWFGKSPLGIMQLFFKVIKSDLVFCWFADVNAFYSVMFAKIFRKKSIVVVGGVDAACEPSIGYGYFYKFLPRLVVTFLYRMVDRILVVDHSLKKNLTEYLSFKKMVKDKTFIVPTGYDSKEWTPGSKSKENMVLTVGTVNMNTLFRKGFITFIQAARKFPKIKFVLVGKLTLPINTIISLVNLHSGSDASFYLPKNLKLTGFVSKEELLKYYRKAKVYCQLSLFEGLPNSLCEAMLCECVPVGTCVNGIPKAIGNKGFYVKVKNVASTVDGIEKALNFNFGALARKRIITKFPLRKRERELVLMIEETRR